MKKRNWFIISILGIIYLSLIIFFIVQSCKTGVDSSRSSNVVAKIIKKVIDALFNTNIEMNDSYLTLIRKLIGHFGFFLVLGLISILFYISLQIKSLYIGIIHYSIGLFLALSSEFIFEANSAGRGPSIYDSLIDILGFILISTVIFVIHVIKKNKVEH